MSYGRISFWLVLVLSVGSLRVAAADGFVAQGNTPTGTSVSYSFGVGGMRRAIVYKKIDGVETIMQDQSWAEPGAASGASISGGVIVPVGSSYEFYWQYWSDNAPSYGNWVQSGLMLSGVSAAGTFEVVTETQLAFKLPATADHPITWQLVDSEGNVVGYVTKDANTPEQVWTVDGLPPDADRADYTLKFFMPGLKFDTDGGTWVSVTDPGDGSPGEATVTPSTIPSSGAGSGAIVPKGTTPTPEQIGVVPAPKTVPLVPPQPPGTGGTVWRSAGGSGGLSDAVFKEGVDKLVNQAGDGAKVAAGILKAKGDGEGAAAAAGGEGASAKSETEAVFGSTPSGTGYVLNPDGAPSLSVSLPSSFGGATFDLNPFQSGRFAQVCDWFRAAVSWLVIAQLAGWLWVQMSDWVRGFSTVPQAKGNPIVGGTGAQATALAAAGLMTVAIVAGLTSLLAWSFGSINVPMLVGSVTTNPMATVPAGVYWMIDQVLPVATIVTALVARITFNMYASTVFAGCAAVVRFIVP